MKKGKSLMGPTIMCSLLIIAFKFGPNGFEWFWSGKEMVPIILGILSIMFGILGVVDYKKSILNLK